MRGTTRLIQKDHLIWDNGPSGILLVELQTYFVEISVYTKH